MFIGRPDSICDQTLRSKVERQQQQQQQQHATSPDDGDDDNFNFVLRHHVSNSRMACPSHITSSKREHEVDMARKMAQSDSPSQID